MAGADNPEEEAVDAVERARIRHALAQMQPEQPAGIELAFFGGMTQQEIATRTETPLGTVKTRIHLGMRKLKELLKE